MLVLDFLRKTTKGEIDIPDFHAGHLGLLKGTEVWLSLLETSSRRNEFGNAHCELIARPYASATESLFRLECTMIDQRGALNKLLKAISALNINVVKQDSAVIDQEHHYSVEMVLDWRTSITPRSSATPSSVAALYSDMSHRIPIHDRRYVRLYEHLLIQCGELLRFDDALGMWLPCIVMVPFVPVQTGSNARPVAVKFNKRRRFLKIPESQIEQIRSSTGYGKNDELQYVLSSDPNHRMLRVFFPKKEVAGKLLHVGFRHLDAPGASLEITGGLEMAGFNILTSLVRHKAKSENSFECLLEYEGGVLPSNGSKQENGDVYSKLEWCRRILAEKVDVRTLNQWRNYNVEVGPPEYPRSQSSEKRVGFKAINSRKDIAGADSLIRSVPLIESEKSFADQVAKLIERMKTAEVPSPEAQWSRVRLMQKLHERLSQNQPRIFLSYPESARQHANLIRKALEAGPTEKLDEQRSPLFVVEDYMSADFMQVVDSVRRRILRCDFFIGIWQHEDGATRVSPWLPFEYGIAVAGGKQCLIAYSQQLPADVWNRIDGGVSKLPFNDLEFSKVVDQIKDHCRTQWFAEWDANQKSPERRAI
jgi:hypothetical protein